MNSKKDCWMCGPCGVGGNAWELAAFIAGCRPDDKKAVGTWLRDHGFSLNGAATDQRQIEATYDYRSLDGELLFQVVRFAPKDFRQRRPDGNNGWIWNLHGMRRVPYRFAELLKTEDVYIVEGEKDVEALAGIGLCATCNPGGAGKWLPDFADYFKSFHRVVVIPDNDTPGRKHANQVVSALFGKVASLKILELPGLPDGGDVSDFIADMDTAEAGEELGNLANRAVEWKPPTDGLAHEPTPETARQDSNWTDSGNAEFFAAIYERDVRYDHRRRRWLLWHRHRWQPDADAEIRRLAKAAMRQRFKEAAAYDDPEERSRAAKWAISSESRARLDALIYLSQAEPPIADAGEGWDSDPWLLGVPNGVVDLRNGVLRPGRQDDRITLCSGVEYHQDARSELWESTIRTILPDDELRDFVHVASGYSATGDTSCDCWFLGNGSGRNGKGTLLQPIRRALGDYACEMPGSVFDLRTERAPYELASLPGRRFVTSSESGDTLRLNHDRLKQLTGGDSMNAANKYEKSFEFDPVCKLWLACNKRPRVTDDTAAFWARVFLIPFSVSFIGKEDRKLRPALIQDPAHQAAVLAWIVRGAVRFYAEGLGNPPAVVRAVTAEYREESDPLAAFLDEATKPEPNGEVAAKELFEHYTRWADAQHFGVKERLTATMFGRLMGARFEFRKDTRSGVKYYKALVSK